MGVPILVAARSESEKFQSSAQTKGVLHARGSRWLGWSSGVVAPPVLCAALFCVCHYMFSAAR
eukprot:9126087-Alexandrium_andersonii.AAC.1